MSNSIRERIVQAICTRLDDMKKGQPAADPYAFSFDRVQRAEFTSSDKGIKFGVAVFDPDNERTPSTYPVTYTNMDIIFEFLVYCEKHEEASTLLNLVFSEVERLIMSDQTFGGLAINCTFTGDEKDIDSRFDKQIEGALRMTVQFRYNTEDPRRIV